MGKSLTQEWLKHESSHFKSLHPHLCEVLQPRWDPYRNVSGPADRRRGDGSRLTSVLWSWNGTGLVHDNGWLAWVVVHVEAWRRGLRVSIGARARRVRSLRHGVRRLARRAWIAWIAWITWKTHTRTKSVSELLSNPFSTFPPPRFTSTAPSTWSVWSMASALQRQVCERARVFAVDHTT